MTCHKCTIQRQKQTVSQGTHAKCIFSTVDSSRLPGADISRSQRLDCCPCQLVNCKALYCTIAPLQAFQLQRTPKVFSVFSAPEKPACPVMACSRPQSCHSNQELTKMPLAAASDLSCPANACHSCHMSSRRPDRLPAKLAGLAAAANSASWERSAPGRRASKLTARAACSSSSSPGVQDGLAATTTERHARTMSQHFKRQTPECRQFELLLLCS